MAASTAEKLGKYILDRELGHGSSGTVYLAHDPFAHRDVAIKVYYAETDVSPEQARLQYKLFFNEAHIAGKLLHPNILPIHDAGEEGGLCYVVMALLEHYQPLTGHCRPDTLLPLPKVIEIFFTMAKALDYAHRNGVIHRDIKPANLMINPEGHIMIVDFGNAKTAVGQTNPTVGVVGTPRYMSPEQVRGEAVTNQSDIFSMGALIYELVAGTPAFSGDTLPGLTHQILHADPQPLIERRSGIPDVLNHIVMRCLRKPLKRRYESCMDIAGDLINVSGSLKARATEINEQEHYNLVSRLDCFKDFTHADIWEIIRASNWEKYADSQTVVAEGEPDTRFFIIASGVVAVHKGNTLLGMLGAGDCFGEMSYLSRMKRTASVRAQGDVNLLCVSPTLMERASRDCQLRFYRMFANALMERLSRANEKLLMVRP